MSNSDSTPVGTAEPAVVTIAQFKANQARAAQEKEARLAEAERQRPAIEFRRMEEQLRIFTEQNQEEGKRHQARMELVKQSELRLQQWKTRGVKK